MTTRMPLRFLPLVVLIGLLALTPPYIQTVFAALGDNLVACYDMSGASNAAEEDQIGSLDFSNNGTVAGSGTSRTFVFSEGDWLSLADNATLDFGDTDFTIAIRMRFTELTDANVPGLVTKGDGATLAGSSYAIRYNRFTNRFSWRLTDASSGDDTEANSFGAATTGVDYFVVARHSASGNTKDISVDGGTVDSEAWSGGVNTNASGIVIGNDDDGGAGEILGGSVSWVGFWSRRISDSEIDDVYASGAEPTCAGVLASGGGGGSKPPAGRTSVGFGR
jgi:hypothetical protein